MVELGFQSWTLMLLQARLFMTDQYDYRGYPIKTNLDAISSIGMHYNRRDPLHDMAYFIHKNNDLLSQIIEFTKLSKQLSSSSLISHSMSVQEKPNPSHFISDTVQDTTSISDTNPRKVLGLRYFILATDASKVVLLLCFTPTVGQ
jgi:hypothetical protein